MSEPPIIPLIKLLSQNDSGRAFEYGIAMSFARLLSAEIEDSIQMRKAQQGFTSSSEREQEKIVRASDEIAMFLIAHDVRLSGRGWTVRIQSDMHGKTGDVRDVIIESNTLPDGVGISAKNRHAAVKHSRLSEQLDFGSDWLGQRCSDNYFHQVVPIFREMNTRRTNGEKWREVADKQVRFYMPILQAFQQEMESLFKLFPAVAPRALVQYLLGRVDYYKIIKHNGTVSVMSFNIDGTLKWGSRIPLPKHITAIKMKEGSKTTLFMTFDKGWQLSFRIHNASTYVEPSLKFDINIIGMPMAISRHEIQYI